MKIDSLQMKDAQNVLITGIPRSGTTLAAAMLDGLENSVCFSEPQWQVDWLEQQIDRKEYAQKVLDDFTHIRKKIRNNEIIQDRRNEDGRSLTNYFNRQRTTQYVLKAMDKDLEPGYLLATKHNAHYSAILDILSYAEIPILVIIRHPVPTILSWLSLNLPISGGRLPAGERLSHEIKMIVESSEDILVKQVLIFDEFCKQYKRCQQHIHLLTYEEIVSDNQVFSKLFGRANIAPILIKNANQNPAYEHHLAEKIKAVIRKHATHIDIYYPELDHY